jgi:hypothetical protein
MEIQTHQSAELNASVVLERVYGAYQPPRDVSIFGVGHRKPNSPEGHHLAPGPFRPEKFQIEMMDVILQPDLHEVVIQKSTQIGGKDFPDRRFWTRCGLYARSPSEQLPARLRLPQRAYA